MARYIDADKLFTWLDIKNRSKYPIGDAEQYNTLLIYEVLGEIDDAETEDVAPVIHAHWIEDCGDYKCSHCSTEFWDEMVFIVRTSEHEFPNYCPVCGAKMDEEVDDE